MCSVERQLSFVGSYLADGGGRSNPRGGGGGGVGGWKLAAFLPRLEQGGRLRGQTRRDFTEGGVDESP